MPSTHKVELKRVGIAAASAYTKTKHMIGGNILHVCPEGKLEQCSILNEEMSIQHGKKHQ